ncbi:phage virion morphogenesis protein [Yersinia alsatica]|uniref:Phage virion morphogenesis protein n=1 Tax=Yersinia alsatica TaxID=2890317 RepID=A0ABY5UV99_9GAMM|nr:phage virion morphogenesis protein [Yersinia alsatica]UWM47422.1 phage virion morphogenesis protein [Yersinia alsatica]
MALYDAPPPFIARKKKRPDKLGRIKRKMFTKLRTARFIKSESNADGDTVTFSGMVNSLVRVHHYGLRDKVTKKGPTVKYERRQLLSFTDGDSEWIGGWLWIVLVSNFLSSIT